MNKYLTIEINFSTALEGKDFSVKHILVDTIEERGIGEVIDEGSGPSFMDVCIKLRSGKTDKDLLPILEALGLKDQSELFYEEIEDEENDE